MEMEQMIQEQSEVLIQELALRDELEEEKELKNQFISLILAVQNKRRQHHLDRKKSVSQVSLGRPSSVRNANHQHNNNRERFDNEDPAEDPKYLTTVIPVQLKKGPPDPKTLQVLIKSES